MQPCVGYPEPDIGITSTRETLGPYQGTGSRELDQKQDLNDRTTYDFVCPPGCGDVAIQRQNGGENSGVYGNGTYGDESYICAAAVHAGVIDDAIGGRFTLQLQRGWGPLAGHDAIGHERDLPVATRFGIESRNLVSTSPRRPRQGWMRTFTLEPYPVMTVEVQTIIGAPNAPLESNCDHLDIQPPQAAKVRAVRVCVWCACMYVCACESYAALALQLIRRSLQLSRPTDVALFVNASLTDQEMLYIADAANNAIRMATAVCSKVCENGGYCISEEKCVCPDGWVGDDCSMPVCKPSCDSLNPGGCVAVWLCLCVAVWLRLTSHVGVTCHSNFICTAPNTCTCKPGYGGPTCGEPQCVQECRHGTCVFPDTCQCDYGWFDPNCTTPVCTQTCGNGGNCTSPDVCTCPSLWTGEDCREVTCKQQCVHGHCIAPDTCMCDIGWSGHDCSKPICHQGFLRKDPHIGWSESVLRPINHTYYTPCNISVWCNSTNEFDCRQRQRVFTNTQVPPIRDLTGHKVTPGECMMMELKPDADTYFRYESELDDLTPFARHTPLTPYGWGPTRYTHEWSSPNNESQPDRQVAWVQWHTVTQGVYVCANGGECASPDVCVCKDGWVGFDCRTPVCKQGYYEPELKNPPYVQEEPGVPVPSGWTTQGQCVQCRVW